MPLLEETFIRCLSCGHPYFVEAHELLLRKEPVRYSDDYNRAELVVENRKLIYKCSKCGEVLNRDAAAKKAEAARNSFAPPKVVRYPQPDSSSGDPDAGKTTTS